jgi:flagellar motor switch/type III secretory pathway protein FliN
MHSPAARTAPHAQPWTAQTLPAQPAAAVHARNALYASPPWRIDGVQWLWQALPDRAVRSAVTLGARDDELRLALIDDIVGLGEPASDHWIACDEPARNVMWTLAHERLLDMLAWLFGRDWVVRSVAVAPFALEPCHHGELRAGFVCRADAMQLRGTATMNEALARSVLERHAASPSAPAPDATASLWAQGRVRMPCVIDRVPARRADLAALRIGALVLLDNPTLATEPAHVHLVLGQRELLCELRGSRLLVLNAANSGDTPMIQTTRSAAMHEDLLDVSQPEPEQVEPRAKLADATHHADDLADHTPITLSFEAGSVSVPLAQLAGVREGYTFFLPHGLDTATIRVFANGVPVGSGQLVRIDDAVGVQLTHLDRSTPTI